MNTTDILSIIFGIISIIVSIVAYYLYIKNNIIKQINGMINNEEDTKKLGEAKKIEVVEQLYAIIPVFFKSFLTKDFISTLVQDAFDKIESYAKKQAYKLAAKTEENTQTKEDVSK